jgi:hypothetical protein
MEMIYIVKMSVKRRCPNGTRKNKISGKCESISQQESTSQSVLKRCPKGTRKNKTSGKCESTSQPVIKRCPKGTHKNKTSGKCEKKKSPAKTSPAKTSPVKKSVKQIQKLMLERVKKVTGDPRELEDDTYIDPSDIYDLREDLDHIIEKESKGLSEADKKTLWRFADYIEYTLREFADEHVGADQVEDIFDKRYI